MQPLNESGLHTLLTSKQHSFWYPGSCPHPHSLVSLEQPPEGTCEHLSQVLPLCPQPSRDLSSLPVEAQVFQVAHKAWHNLFCPFSALAFSLSSPCSLCSRHTGLLAVLTHQAWCCPRIFP